MYKFLEMKKQKAPHLVSSQPCSCSKEVAESYTRVTLSEGWDSVNFMNCNNNARDAAEIEALIKFHASRCELITAGLRRDLFLVVLTGTRGQVHSVRLLTLLSTSKKETAQAGNLTPTSWASVVCHSKGRRMR